MVPGSWRDKIRHGVLYGIALCIGFIFVAAPWSYRLAKEFGKIRCSRCSTLSSVHLNSRRNRWSSIDSFRRPLLTPYGARFAMINPIAMVHEELRAPDPRYAIVVILGTVCILNWAWKRYGQASPSPSDTQLKEPTRACLPRLGFGLGVQWISGGCTHPATAVTSWLWPALRAARHCRKCCFSFSNRDQRCVITF